MFTKLMYLYVFILWALSKLLLFRFNYFYYLYIYTVYLHINISFCATVLHCFTYTHNFTYTFEVTNFMSLRKQLIILRSSRSIYNSALIAKVHGTFKTNIVSASITRSEGVIDQKCKCLMQLTCERNSAVHLHFPYTSRYNYDVN